MAGLLLTAFLMLLQTAMWMQAEASTPTYPPSLPPIYLYSIPESYGSNLSIYENVSINANNPVLALELQGFPITYSIPPYSLHSNIFCMKDNSSGLIYVCHGVILDREVLTPTPQQASLLLTVVASNGAFTASTAVYVYLIDANDNPPQFTNLPATVSLSETSASGTTVYTITATNKDLTFFPTYVIANSNTFTVTPATGIVTLSGSLDYNIQQFYSLTITLKDELNDSIALTSTATLIVMVTPVSRRPPVFTPSSYLASVFENSTNGTSVAQVFARDGDLGINDTIIYSIINGNSLLTRGNITSPSFTIGNLSGVIYVLSSRLEWDQWSSYYLTVQGTKQHTPSLFSITLVVITVVDDMSDNTPMFPQDIYTASVQETTSVGFVVLSVTAIDPKVLNMVEFYYAIVNTSVPFSIDQLGVIRTNGSISYATAMEYSFEVIAVEYQVPIAIRKTATATVVITVIQLNLHAPVFNNSTYSVSIYEGRLYSTVIMVNAMDADLGTFGVVSYSITQNNMGGPFSINSTSGYISMTAPVDYRVQTLYTLQVQAVDGATPLQQKTGTCTVIINVLAIIKEPPVFDNPPLNVSIIETASPGTFFYTFKYHDPNPVVPPAVPILSILSGNELGQFQLNGSSLYTSATLNYDIINNYTLVLLLNNSVYTSNYTVKVLLIHANKYSPMFANGSYYFEVSESAPNGTSVGAISATDADTGVYGQVMYSLAGAGSYSFAVDNSTGAINTSGPLNRLATPLYTFFGVAFDLDPSTRRSATVNITIKVTNDNNHPPMFNVPQVVYYVVENIAFLVNLSGSPLMVTATNLNMGLYASITYLIVSGNTNMLFKLDNSTGLLSRNPLVAIDREQTSQYNLTILAMITATPALNSTIFVTVNIVDVNDNAPEFSSTNYSISLPESTAPGYTYQFYATDLDTGTNAQMSFSIVANISTFKASSVAMATNGTLTLTAGLDREAFAGPYGITVMVTDAGTPPLNSSSLLLLYVTDVNDNAPIFPLDIYAVQVSPSVSQTYITMVTAFDKDQPGTPNSNVTYSIVGSSQAPFSINLWTGVITSTSALQSLDSFQITVVAADQGTPPLSSITTVAINVSAVYDATPNFTMSYYVFNVTEDTSINTRLEGISAWAGAGISVLYSTNFSGPFIIDSSTGELILVSALSYEYEYLYDMIVVAQNIGYPSKQSMCNVVINVLQVNKYSPVFSSAYYITTVLQGSQPNTTVIKVVATDADVGIFGKVTYSIIGGNTGGAFSINQSSGQLTTAVVINRSVPVYTLTLLAMDGGAPPRSSATVVMVTVNYTNDYAPTFSSAMYTGSVPETTPPGFTVVIVSATDGDFGSSAVVRYSINDTTNFVIDSIYGVVTTNVTFNYEVQSQYFINVTACDLGTPPQANSTVITVQIIDVNLHAPMFDSTLSPISIREDVPVNYMVTTVTATDLDSGSNALISYDLANDQGYFTITSSGNIVVSAPMEEEVISSYNLTIIATDCGSPQRSSATTYLPITILDIDSLPTFTQAVYMVPVTYPNGVNVTISATDLDQGLNPNISYVIAQGDTSVFGISVNAGPVVTVYNKEPLTQPAYSLRIDAFYLDQNQTRTSATISIVVSGIKTAPSLVPSFGVSSFTQSISEASPIGTLLYPSLYAVANTSISYSLGGCASSFAVDATTGIIELVNILDREAVGSYNCTLMASNSFGNTTSVLLTVVVLDANDNVPTFSSTLYSVNVNENTRVGKSLARVVAMDADEGLSAVITYTILSGDDTPFPKFSINPSTGTITTTSTPLDRNVRASYTLIVQANDSVNQAFAVVYVTVLDQNDHTPTFIGAPYVSNMSESSLIVTSVQATDVDVGLNAVIKFSISLGNTSVFQIDENSGLITARSNMLSYDTIATYTLWVLAVDQPVNVCERRTAVTTVTINLLPSNDHHPVFSQNTYTISIFENITVGQLVLNVAATDADPGLNGQFTYHINQNLSSSSFSIDSLSGSIKSTALLDWEVQSYHLLIVEAADKGTPPLTGTAAVYITLLDVNDNPPYFNSSYYFTSVGEGASIGSSVIIVQASDADSNSTLTYSLSGDVYPYGFFKVNTYSGLIQIARTLDTEIRSLVNLTIQATDGVYTGSTFVQILVTNDNTKAPQFVQTSYNCTIPENSPAGARVSVLLYDGSSSRIVAMDPDVPSTQVVYQLAGNAQNYFYINATTGAMFVKQGAVLDRESRTGYWLYGYVVAIDNSGYGMSSTAQLTVQITDVIEHPPVFSGLLGYSLALLESTPNQVISNQIKATSVDFQSIAYSIIGASPWPITSSLFAIDMSTAILNLTGVVNREVFPFSNQTIQARGNVIPALYTTTSLQVSVVDLNDHAPVFTSLVYTAIVVENITVGGPVLQNVSALDPDLGYGGVVIYNITASDGPFFINPVTGLVSTTAYLSYKAKRQYTLTIQACDEGTPVLCSSTLAGVQVTDSNDHAPVFTYPTYQLSIPSNLTQNTPIIRPVATVANSGAAAQISYSILSGTNLLTMDPTSGLMTLSRAITSSDVGNTFTFNLVAVDGGASPLSGYSTVSITIFNASSTQPRFLSVYNEASVVEENYVGKVMDFTTNSNVASYMLSSDLTAMFGLSTMQSSGGVILATIFTRVSLDREQVDRYNLLITETSSGVSAQSVYLTVLDVNDNSPTFLQPLYSFSVLEGTAPVPLGTITAFDLDAGNNGTVVYSLLPASNPSGLFSINNTSGQLTVASPLNREQTAFYNLTVIGMDLGTPSSLSSFVTVLVTVLDANDNPPTFSQASYNTSILDNVPVGSSVLAVVATDVDTGTNAQIGYSILSGSNGQFTIDSTNGLITTVTSLSFITKNTYVLVVMATDHGMPALSTNVTVMVTLNDSNDCTPTFLSNVTSRISVPEGTTPLRNIASLGSYVVDCDPGPAGLSYSILAGNTLSWFSINSTSGVITTAMPLDRENVSSFLLTVQVKDGFPPVLAKSSQLEIQINVTDTNDNPPVFPVNTYYITVYESAAVGQTVFTVAASDKDTSSNAAITYSLQGQATFLSVTSRGSLVITKALSRGVSNVTVVATDGGIPPMNSSAVVAVTVLGVNSHNPVFSNILVSPRTTVSIYENASLGDVVFVAIATDQDIGSNGQVTFSFGIGNEDGKFSLQPLTGVITVAGKLSYYLSQYYQLTVLAQDRGVPPRSASGSLTVQITPSTNYYPPAFLYTSYVISLAETTKNNTQAIIMTATDRDLPGTPAARITYLLTGQNSSYFRINSSTGVVYTNGILNQRLISSFLLEVVAINDHASPVLLSSVNLMVTITTAINTLPVFVLQSYSISISELTPSGTTVLTVLATDSDQPGTPNSRVTYSFPVGTVSNVFALNPSSGDLVLYSTLDWSITPYYSLVICASDAGAPSKLAYTTVNVSILDQNTYPPVFNYRIPSVSVYENVSTFPWPLNVNLSYTDKDSPYNAISAYFIVSVNGLQPDTTFSLNQSTGALTLNNIVEVLKIRTYTIIVTVVNVHMGKGPLCPALPTPCKFADTATITVTVLDDNDKSPTFNSTIYYISISNDNAVGTAIASLQATDPDDGVFGQAGITYLFYGNVARTNQFRIDTQAGGVAVIYTSALLGNYDGVTFNLKVVAMDGGVPPNTNSTNVSILVLSNTKRLLVTFACDVNTIYAQQAAIVNALNKAVPGYNVTVEVIQPLIDPSTGQPVSNITQLYFHVYDIENKTYIDYLLYYDLAGDLYAENGTSVFDVLLNGTIPSNCSVKSLQPLSMFLTAATTPPPITYTPYTPGKNYTETITVTVKVTAPALPVILPAYVDTQILIVMIFCGVLVFGAVILTLMAFYQRYAALHDARTKLLHDVFYGNQGASNVENIQMQNLQLDELNTNAQIQRENPIFVHPYEDWIGTIDPTKASIGEESYGTKQLDNPLYEEQELQMEMFSQDSDDDGEVDEAELLAAALQDDEDNEDNAITTI